MKNRLGYFVAASTGLPDDWLHRLLIVAVLADLVYLRYSLFQTGRDYHLRDLVPFVVLLGVALLWWLAG